MRRVDGGGVVDADTTTVVGVVVGSVFGVRVLLFLVA